jgi:hypothetical protein
MRGWYSLPKKVVIFILFKIHFAVMPVGNKKIRDKIRCYYVLPSEALKVRITMSRYLIVLDVVEAIETCSLSLLAVFYFSFSFFMFFYSLLVCPNKLFEHLFSIRSDILYTNIPASPVSFVFFFFRLLLYFLWVVHSLFLGTDTNATTCLTLKVPT